MKFYYFHYNNLVLKSEDDKIPFKTPKCSGFPGDSWGDGDMARSLSLFLFYSKLKTFDTSDRYIIKADTLKSIYSDVTRISVTRF